METTVIVQPKQFDKGIKIFWHKNNTTAADSYHISRCWNMWTLSLQWRAEYSRIDTQCKNFKPSFSCAKIDIGGATKFSQFQKARAVQNHYSKLLRWEWHKLHSGIYNAGQCVYYLNGIATIRTTAMASRTIITYIPVTQTNTIIHLRVGQKTRLFLRVDNFAMVNGRKACDVKSFIILSRKSV